MSSIRRDLKRALAFLIALLAFQILHPTFCLAEEDEPHRCARELASLKLPIAEYDRLGYCAPMDDLSECHYTTQDEHDQDLKNLAAKMKECNTVTHCGYSLGAGNKINFVFKCNGSDVHLPVDDPSLLAGPLLTAAGLCNAINAGDVQYPTCPNKYPGQDVIAWWENGGNMAVTCDTKKTTLIAAGCGTGNSAPDVEPAPVQAASH
jgi:hypothetical protein